MDEKNSVLEVRIYTGNGYEDFSIDQKIKNTHILNKSGREELTVKEIYISGDMVHIIFDECVGFIYRGVQLHRESYEYVRD